jgi:DNA invertase Pin-like site-specific DNA recombinase
MMRPRGSCDPTETPNVIAALYARKSTEQAGVADDQKSVARQVEHARAYAARKGWHVDEEHIYVDDGISGAEFKARPGYTRLLNAISRGRRAPFEILIVAELSRLGREQLETGYVVKQLAERGVRIFSYLDDREVVLDSSTDKFVLAALNFGAEVEREKGRQRTYDAMLRKARAGHVTGGRVFGYDNVRLDTGGVRRVIKDAEAAVVRQIFELTSSGHGITTIARRLNDDRAPSPRAQQGRPSGWAPSSVREVLHRELYRGVIVWNQSRKRDRWGKKNQKPRPESEWIRVPVPDLAIIPASLWAAAHVQMDRQRARYSGTSKRGAPPWGREGRYLLTGLLRCSVCGGGLEARSRRTTGSDREVLYGCSVHHRRGNAVCTNALTVPMDVADDAVIEAVRKGLLDPRVLATAVRRVADRVSRRQGKSSREVLRRDLAAIERELENLTGAVAAGGDVPTLIAAIRDRETTRQALVDQLERDRRVIPIDAPAVVADLEHRLTEWRELLRDEPPKARGLLKQLIVGRLDMAPDMKRGLYRFSGTGTLSSMLAGIIDLSQLMVHKAWRPHEESTIS